MIKSFRRVSLIGLLLYNFAFTAQSLAQEKQLKKINWGVTSLSAGNWIPWLAKEAKIYQSVDSTSSWSCCAARGRPRRRSSAAASSPRRWCCRRSCSPT